ncbi:MAG: methicillin resistance protein [uncultured bacterium]|nr:MAG: methicillin resistance protein [uncultured bacterium]
MTDIRQSENYAKYLETQGWVVSAKGGERIYYFIKKFPIIGAVLKIQRPKKIDFETIQKLEKKYKVFQTIIEPDLPFTNSTSDHNLLLHNGYKLSKSPFLPTKTLQIDLNQTENQILRNFSKDCRYSIKRGEGLEIRECSTPSEIENFYIAWKKSVNFKRYVPSLHSLESLKKSFPQKRSLILTSHNKAGGIIGGALFTTSSHGDVSDYITYYWYAFTNKEGRTSLSQYSLLYRGILWAKSMGSKVFDFEGIYDGRFPTKSWLGFTHFKKSFGGQEVLYPGCYTKVRLPI